jgi:hypothetical protein
LILFCKHSSAWINALLLLGAVSGAGGAIGGFDGCCGPGRLAAAAAAPAAASAAGARASAQLSSLPLRRRSAAFVASADS